MDRKMFLEMCHKVVCLTEGVLGIKKNVPEELCVVYDGIVYYPVAYRLSFDKAGYAVHTAVLHSLSANSTTDAKLEKVEVANENNGIRA